MELIYLAHTRDVDLATLNTFYYDLLYNEYIL